MIYLSNFDWNPTKTIDSGSLVLLYLFSVQVFEVKDKESHIQFCVFSAAY